MSADELALEKLARQGDEWNNAALLARAVLRLQGEVSEFAMASGMDHRIIGDRLAALERRDTPDGGSVHVICNRLYNEAKDRYDAAIARAETAEREFAREESNHHVTIKRVRDITAERDAERERAGRLQALIEMGERVYRNGNTFERFIPSNTRMSWTHGTWIPRDPVDLALPASDTKEDAP